MNKGCLWILLLAAALTAYQMFARLSDIDKLKQGSSWEKAQAARALGLKQKQEAIPALMQHLDYYDEDVRLAVVYSLGQLRAQEAIAPLCESLLKHDCKWRIQVVEALGKIGSPKAIPAMFANIPENDWVMLGAHVTNSVAQMSGPQAVPFLLRVQNHPQQTARLIVLEALARSLPAKADFYHACRDIYAVDLTVRAKATQKLGELKAEESVPHLVHALYDSASDVQEAARQALRTIKSPQTMPLLVVNLKNEKVAVRKRTAEILGEIRASRVSDSLLPCLGDADEQMRETAAKSLGSIYPNKAKLYIAITRIYEEYGYHEEEPHNSEDAVKLLCEENMREAVPHLLQCIKKTSYNHDRLAMLAQALGRFKAREAIPELLTLLAKSGGPARAKAAWALGEMKASEAVKPLLDRFDDDDAEVAWAAARALTRIQAKETADVLLVKFKEWEGLKLRLCIWTLGQLGDARAIEPMQQACSRMAKDDSLWALTAMSLGILHIHLREFDKAESVLTELCRLHADYSGARNNLLVALLRQNKIGEAAAELDAWIEMSSEMLMRRGVNEAVLQTHRNHVNAALKQTQDVAKEARERAFDAPGKEFPTAEIAYNSGWLFDEKGNYAEAVKQYDQAISLSPDNAKYLIARGIALAKSGKLQEAKKDLLAAREKTKAQATPQMKYLHALALQNIAVLKEMFGNK